MVVAGCVCVYVCVSAWCFVCVFQYCEASFVCLSVVLCVCVFQVVRVGVTVYRYVSLCHARHWLIHTLKNNRGRGWHSDWGQVSGAHPLPP